MTIMMPEAAASAVLLAASRSHLVLEEPVSLKHTNERCGRIGRSLAAPAVDIRAV
jgi:hypothetical protein